MYVSPDSIRFFDSFLLNAVRYNPLRVLDPNFHVEVAAVWQRVNDLTIYIGQKMDQLAVLLEEEAQKAQQWLDEQAKDHSRAQLLFSCSP